MSRKARTRCPHCKSTAAIRTSRELSDISREAYYQCTNHLCGFTWKALVSAVATIVPSRTPNPTVNIPMSDKLVSQPPPSG